MKVTSQQVAAYADGELAPAEEARVRDAIADSPQLAAQLASHQALRARLYAHYAPVADQPVPQRLSEPLDSSRREMPRLRPPPPARTAPAGSAPPRLLRRWQWRIAGPALAASLAIAFLMPGDAGSGRYAGRGLATALDTLPSASQSANAPARILLSFRDDSGAYCRAYNAASQGGIACKDQQGWRIVESSGASSRKAGEYRQATSDVPALLARAQDLASGPALDKEAEARAIASGWR